jgi:hypothetical protein
MLHTKIHSAIRSLLLAPLTIATPAWAVTYYVDDNANCATADGTAAKPFCTIQAAVNKAAASGDTVQVAAGDYDAVEIKSKSLRLLGADPTTTFIYGSNNAGVQNYGININTFATAGGSVEIAGFTIASVNGNSKGVILDSGSNTSGNLSASLHNCILIDHLYAVWVDQANANVFNNVIAKSIQSGVYAQDYAYVTATNNIIVNNENGIFSVGNCGCCCENINEIYSSYNTYFDNNVHRFEQDGDNNTLTTFNDVDDVDPLFIDNVSGDYHVQAASTTRNTGSPAAADKDPDGTRNDKGAYGGPGAIGFWPLPGLPIVTGLTITPSTVATGGTISIQATGKSQ